MIYLNSRSWGIHINREIEVHAAHKNYFIEYGPRRNRLTHSMVFEEFEMVLERWQDLEEQYEKEGIIYYFPPEFIGDKFLESIE